jgi:SAM-dependent methyltransferase
MKKDINDYFTMLLEEQKIEILTIALKLKIFQILDEKKHSSQSLAKLLNLDAYNTKVFLDGLVLLNLLEKHQTLYSNKAIAKEHFIFGSSNYCGDVFLHRKEMLNHGKRMLEKLLKEGNTQKKESRQPLKWANAAKKFLKQEQKIFVVKPALEIITKLPEFHCCKKMLDLGCSSGLVGLELLKCHPSLKAIFFDYEEVTQVVKKHINEYEMDSRAKTLSGDIQSDDIGKNYDLIWGSSIFYFMSNKQEVLEKIYKALNPGGLFVSLHVEIDEKDFSKINDYFYFLFLNMQKRNLLKPKELPMLLEKVGFQTTHSFCDTKNPMATSQIYIAKKIV